MNDDVLKEISVLFEFLRDNIPELEMGIINPHVREDLDEAMERLKQAVFEATWRKQHTVAEIAEAGQISYEDAVRYIHFSIEAVCEGSLILPNEFGRMFGRN